MNHCIHLRSVTLILIYKFNYYKIKHSKNVLRKNEDSTNLLQVPKSGIPQIGSISEGRVLTQLPIINFTTE